MQVTTEVLELLAKGAIAETQYTPQNFVSQIFQVQPPDQTIIVHLSRAGSSTEWPVLSITVHEQCNSSELYKSEVGGTVSKALS